MGYGIENGVAVCASVGGKLMVPHDGYHWHHQTTRFFEGWYFRLTLPEIAQTFAFMYSIDDPAGGTDHCGGAAQILGPNEDYYCRTFPDVDTFWAWPHKLGLGHWRSGSAKYLSCDRFTQQVPEGYQATDTLHQGTLLTPAGTPKAQWHYTTQPIYSWGTPTPRATAGWLSYLPVFEPGWQVLMAHGLATGYVDWWEDNAQQATRYEFTDAPAYAEKNWGGAFPAKWFWIQCNTFVDAPTLSITAVAGVREVLMFTENVGLIGIHHQGQFYEFFSTQTAFTWQVDPWGTWHMTARSHRYRIVLTGHAQDEGTYVRVPTRDGLKFLCRDTTHGNLRLQLWDTAGKERLIIDTSSDLAGLEVGGGPWDERWRNR